VTHTEIIEMVANAVGSTYEEAHGFAQTFIDIVISRLDAGDEVKIRGLGTFKWAPVMGKPIPYRAHVCVDPFCARCATEKVRHISLPVGMKLRFIPAVKFKKRRAIMPDEDEGMNKYAVVTEDQDDTKTAGVEKICPICGKTLDSGGACPEHGTEPFEPND
jgi:hypothetical protein